MSIFRAKLMGSTTLTPLERTQSVSSQSLEGELRQKYGLSPVVAKVVADIMQERKDAALDIVAHTGNVLPMPAPESHLRVVPKERMTEAMSETTHGTLDPKPIGYEKKAA